MMFNLPFPSPGEKISANLIREIIRAIRALTPIKGRGMKISHGPNGTVYSTESDHRSAHNIHPLPWTFHCKIENEGESNETRTGGWYNGQVQLGLNCHYFGDCLITKRIDVGGAVDLVSGGTIEDCDQTEDGTYYLEIKPSVTSGVLKLVRYGSGGRDGSPWNDFANDTYYVYIGTVENGIQTDGIYCVPVIYKYL